MPVLAGERSGGDQGRAAEAAVACDWQASVTAMHAERAAARSEPAVASRAFTREAIALAQQGRLKEAVGMLEQEAAIARSLAQGVPDCPPAEFDAISKCLVRCEQEDIPQTRETCRNELYDLFGICIGSTSEVDKAIKGLLTRQKKRRMGQAQKVLETEDDDLERLKAQVDAIEHVLRASARKILIHKIREEEIQISLRGQAPHPDGCWIAFRGEEAFIGTDVSSPVRNAFLDVMRKLHRTSFDAQYYPAARDRLTLKFDETLWSVQWRNVARSVVASFGAAAQVQSRNIIASASPAPSEKVNLSLPVADGVEEEWKSEVEHETSRIAERGAVRARAAEEATEDEATEEYTNKEEGANEYTEDALRVAVAAAHAARFNADLGMDKVMDWTSSPLSEHEAESLDLHVDGWPLVTAMDRGASGDQTAAVGAHIPAADLAITQVPEAGIATLDGRGSLPQHAVPQHALDLQRLPAQEEVDVLLGRALSFSGMPSDV